MKRVLLVGASMIALAGCGGSSAPVGENSADSITTTAVGNVVATVPSPTPAATENAAAADNVAADNAADVPADAADTVTENATHGD